MTGEGVSGWRRSTLAEGYPSTTMDAGGLNDRVRDGTGCTPTALVTNNGESSTVVLCGKNYE